MTENIENLILSHLRAMRGDIATLTNSVDGLRERIGSLEEHVVGMRRDMSLGQQTCSVGWQKPILSCKV